MAVAPCQNADAPSLMRLAFDLSPSLLMRELTGILRTAESRSIFRSSKGR